MKLIDAVALEKELYEAGFKTDNVTQKRDSSSWIRHKLFEQVVNENMTTFNYSFEEQNNDWLTEKKKEVQE